VIGTSASVRPRGMSDVPKGLQMFSAMPVAMGMQVLPTPVKFPAEIPARRYSEFRVCSLSWGRKSKENKEGWM